MKNLKEFLTEGLFGGSNHKAPNTDNCLLYLEPGDTIYYTAGQPTTLLQRQTIKEGKILEIEKGKVARRGTFYKILVDDGSLMHTTLYFEENSMKGDIAMELIQNWVTYPQYAIIISSHKFVPGPVWKKILSENNYNVYGNKTYETIQKSWKKD